MVRGALSACSHSRTTSRSFRRSAAATPCSMRPVPANRRRPARHRDARPGRDRGCGGARRELPETRTLILTTFGRPGYLRRAIESGASGFVLKDAPAEQLAEAVREVNAGRRVIDPGLAADAIADGVSPSPSASATSLPPPAGTRRLPRSQRSCTSPKGRCGTISAPRSESWSAQPRRGARHRRSQGLALTAVEHPAGVDVDQPPLVRCDEPSSVGRRRLLRIVMNASRMSARTNPFNAPWRLAGFRPRRPTRSSAARR